MSPLGTLRRALCVVGGLAVPQGATGCNTHDCDSQTVCIDGRGLMKAVDNTDDCKADTGGTPIAGDAGPPYNLQISTNLSASGYEVVWETTSINGPWLDFPGQRTYVIQYPPGLWGHLPTSIEVYVSYDNPPNAMNVESDGGAEAATSADADAEALPHMNFTTASGALAEIENTTPTQLSLLNATCTETFMRMVVRAQVAGPSDASSDGPVPDEQ
jgi:hypothetical protein